MLAPPLERLEPADAQMSSRNRPGAPALWLHRPIEKCEIGSWGSFRICVEQVVGAHVVLVYRALYQPHPKRLCVEAVILSNTRRDRGHVVKSGQLHI